MHRQDGRGPRTLDKWVLALAALAVLVRLAYVAEGGRDPSFSRLIIDELEYHELGQSLAQGIAAGNEAFRRPPLYPYFLAVIYSVFGPSLVVARFAQALLGGGTCLVTYLLGRELFDRRTGLIAGAVTALYGPLVFLDERLQGTSLEVFCFCLALLAAVRAARRSTWSRWLYCGMAIGVAALARPTIALFAVVAVLWIGVAAVRERRFGKGAGRLAGLLGGCVAVIAPVTVRNYVVSREFVPICYLGGINLYLGNNPDSATTIAIRPGMAWNRLERLPHAEGTVTDAQAEQYFLDRVASYVRRQPIDFLAGLVRKARLFCSSVEVPRNFDVYLQRQFSHVLQVLIWRVGGFGFPLGVVAPLAVLGMAIACRDRPERLLAVGYVLACGLSVILFFNASRYRVPVVPVLAVFAVWGVQWLGRQWSTMKHGRVGAGLATVLAVGVAVSLPAAAPYGGTKAQADFYLCVGSRLADERDLASAERAYLKALELTPDSAEVHVRLSYIAAQLGRRADALRYARTAVRLAPDYADTHITLGLALAKAGDPGEALAEFRRATELEPGYSNAQASLAAALARGGQYAAAADHLRQAVRFSATEPAYYIGLAQMLSREARYREAIEILDQGRQQTDSADVMDELAWLLATCPDDSLRDAERALTLNDLALRTRQPDQATYLDTRAAALAAAGRFDEAAAVAAQARQLARDAGRYDQAAAINNRQRAYVAHQPCLDPIRSPTAPVNAPAQQ